MPIARSSCSSRLGSSLVAAIVAQRAPAGAMRAALEFVDAQARRARAASSGLAGVLAVAVSPTARTSTPSGRAATRSPSSRATPRPARSRQLEVQKDGVGGVDGIAYASALAISPDGAHVYVAGSRDDAVASFSRDPATGALTFLEAQKEGTAGVEGIRYARAHRHQPRRRSSCTPPARSPTRSPSSSATR